MSISEVVVTPARPTKSPVPPLALVGAPISNVVRLLTTSPRVSRPSEKDKLPLMNAALAGAERLAASTAAADNPASLVFKVVLLNLAVIFTLNGNARFACIKQSPCQK